MDDKFKLFVESVGEALGQYAKEAKDLKDATFGSQNESFATGYLSGLHRVITLMQQQAEMFDISPCDIGLNIDENDLI